MNKKTKRRKKWKESKLNKKPKREHKRWKRKLRTRDLLQLRKKRKWVSCQSLWKKWNKLQYLYLLSPKPRKVLRILKNKVLNLKKPNQQLPSSQLLNPTRLRRSKLVHKKRLKQHPPSLLQMNQSKDHVFWTLIQTTLLYEATSIQTKLLATVPGALQLLLKVLMSLMRKQNLSQKKKMKRNFWLLILSHHQNRLGLHP